MNGINTHRVCVCVWVVKVSSPQHRGCGLTAPRTRRGAVNDGPFTADDTSVRGGYVNARTNGGTRTKRDSFCAFTYLPGFQNFIVERGVAILAATSRVASTGAVTSHGGGFVFMTVS